MTAAKHTAGPLAVAISDGDIPNAHCLLEAENHDVVAIVTLPFPFDTNYSERDANAHRLALAWNCHEQMLEALSECLDELEYLMKASDSDYARPSESTITQVRAAIAKATGAAQ
jgi:hypothetical protein